MEIELDIQQGPPGGYNEISQKKTCFFKEQNAGFSARIYRVTLTKTCSHLNNVKHGYSMDSVTAIQKH